MALSILPSTFCVKRYAHTNPFNYPFDYGDLCFMASTHCIDDSSGAGLLEF